MVKLKFDEQTARLAANTLRMLAADAVQKANSGHPGMPMGMADCALILWTHFLKFNPKVPDWYNRDRFVLSAGHGSMLLYSLLYLSGFDVSMEDLKQFRQWGSRTPGHPEYNCLPGVETTTGPLGQGFANGVGMAIAAKMTAARYNRPDYEVLGTHRVYAIVSDGDLMEGISSEAASLAGHLKLGNLIYIYDNNHITIEGKTDLAFSEDVARRFEAYGWHTRHIDGHDYQQITEALQEAVEEEERPSLILARTHIGFGSPNKQDTAAVHGAPLGEEELKRTKEHLGWPTDKFFYVPDETRQLFENRVAEVQNDYQQWEIQFKEWQKKFPDLAEEFQKSLNREIPASVIEKLTHYTNTEPKATRALSGEVLQIISEEVPSLVGGSADLAPSNNTYLKKFGDIAANHFEGRNFHFGIREHAMGGIANGLALYGGFIPYTGTFLVFSDYMRPSIRLAALMEIPVIYVFTHDSIFLGEDGPTHQPVEHLAALRAIPGLTVLRPANDREVAAAWLFALQNTHGPTALIFTRQKVKPVKTHSVKLETISKGAYIVVKEKTQTPDVVLVASGSEVPLAVESQQVLAAENISARVVSLLSWELFQSQEEDFRNQILGAENIPIFVIEAGVQQGWYEVLQRPYAMLGINRFGASAPYTVLSEKFGFTPQQVAERVKAYLNKV